MGKKAAKQNEWSLVPYIRMERRGARRKERVKW